MSDPPQKAAKLLQQAGELGLTWVEVPGFFRADRRFEIAEADARVWVHWFPGKTARSVGTIRITYYDGRSPARMKQTEYQATLASLIALRAA